MRGQNRWQPKALQLPGLCCALMTTLSKPSSWNGANHAPTGTAVLACDQAITGLATPHSQKHAAAEAYSWACLDPGHMAVL